MVVAIDSDWSWQCWITLCFSFYIKSTLEWNTMFPSDPIFKWVCPYKTTGKGTTQFPFYATSLSSPWLYTTSLETQISLWVYSKQHDRSPWIAHDSCNWKIFLLYLLSAVKALENPLVISSPAIRQSSTGFTLLLRQSKTKETLP